jgi:hypothetical protein
MRIAMFPRSFAALLLLCWKRPAKPLKTGFLRSGDALYLACADEDGDRHMRKTARHFT